MFDKQAEAYFARMIKEAIKFKKESGKQVINCSTIVKKKSGTIEISAKLNIYV